MPAACLPTLEDLAITRPATLPGCATRAYGQGMAKFRESVRKAASNLRQIRWPKRDQTKTDKRQIDRWESEGGAIRDDSDDSDDTRGGE